MTQLPMSDWQVYYEGGDIIHLAMHTDKGYLQWTKVDLLHPLKDFSGSDNLKSVIIDAVDRTLVT